jgi:hypothetical protein
MDWLLLILRFVLRTFTDGDSNSVAMAARIDGRVEQRRRWDSADGPGWSLRELWRRFDSWRRGETPSRRSAFKRRTPRRASTLGPVRKRL